MYSFSHIVPLIITSLISFLPFTQSAATQCNRVTIDNVAIPTDICYYQQTYGYMQYSCSDKILYRYPQSNASKPCGTIPIPSTIYGNTTWFCGGTTCGWVDDIQCDKPSGRKITAKTLDYCMGYAGSDLSTSYSYHCCTDGKTVVQKNWLSSLDCESSNTKHLLSHFTFNATCLPNTDRSSGSIFNITQRVGYVKCNPDAMVTCKGIRPMSTTNPPKTTSTTTMKPKTTSTSTPKTTTTRRKTTRTTSANSSTTTSQPSKSPSFTTTTNSSGSTMSPSQRTTKKPSTTSTSTKSSTSSTISSTSTSMTSTSTMSTATKSTMNPNGTNSSLSPTMFPTMFPTTNSSGSPNSVGNNKPKGDLIWIIVLIIVAVMCLCCAGAYWFGTKKPEGTSLQGGDASRPLTRGSLEYDDQEIQYVH